MSSFHTTPHTTYWACGPDQAVEVAGNEQAGVTFDGAGDAPNTSQDLDRIFADALDDLFPNAGVNLGNPEATNAGVFQPTFGNLRRVPGTYNQINADFLGAWLAPTPQSHTLASTPSDVVWDEHVIPPAQLMLEPQGIPLPRSFATSAQPSQTELAWQFGPSRFGDPTPLYTDRNGATIGPYFDFSQIVGFTSWVSGGLGATSVGIADIGTSQSESQAAHTLVSQRTIPGKRPRSEDTNNDRLEVNSNQGPRPRKRVKGKMVAEGVSEAVGSTSRAPLELATETPVETSCKSKAAGRGAGMLTAPSAHEIYYRFLPGPSVQKELVGTAAQGQLPWVEGRVEEAAPRHENNAAQQQAALPSNAEVGKKGHFRIPEELSERQRSLLQATSEDLARGIVQGLKCRLCPDAGLHKWEDFKRHCNHSEAHPLEILFCQYCGDFFARSDSLDRHQEHRPRQCLDVSPTEAEAKRTETKKVHDGFQEKLERCLGDSEEVWTPFSQTIKAMYPKSSKRGSRQQCRMKSKA